MLSQDELNKIRENPKLEHIPALLEHVAALRDALKDRVFYASDKELYGRTGYTLETDSDTAIRDIKYRNRPLYQTPDEAIDAFLAKHYSDSARQSLARKEGV